MTRLFNRPYQITLTLIDSWMKLIFTWERIAWAGTAVILTLISYRVAYLKTWENFPHLIQNAYKYERMEIWRGDQILAYCPIGARTEPELICSLGQTDYIKLVGAVRKP